MSTSAKTFESVFQKQQSKVNELRNSKAKERIRKLRSIREWTLKNEDLIAQAIYADFKKSKTEVNLGEVMPLIGELNYINRNLKNWMAAHSVPVPLIFLGTKNYLFPQSKGNALIISPWNYPFVLAIKPLLSAIAAGCTAILKPSELTPNTARVISDMISELFDENEVYVFTGGADVAIELQKLPFNHVFFTGSPKVGKAVMAAAAKNLASVTLELGGKSPCIVDETADIKEAGKKIAFGKFINAGQTCIAPDYIFVHESKKEALIESLVSSYNKQSSNDFEKSPDFCRIVNKQHFERIDGLINEAIELGAKKDFGGLKRKEDCYIQPVILSNVLPTMRLMKEEIFGPLLPILTYKNLEDVVQYIRANEKPLAIYLFSKNTKNQSFIDRQTSSGSVVHNDFAIQFIYHGIPFGGVNNSGIGYSGGYEGFLAFSHLKPVIKNIFSPTTMYYPPYTKTVQKFIRFMIKYLA